jgi:hypothetical protein
MISAVVGFWIGHMPSTRAITVAIGSVPIRCSRHQVGSSSWFEVLEYEILIIGIVYIPRDQFWLYQLLALRRQPSGGSNWLKVSGGCACGAIRYEYVGEPLFAGYCYCRDCQRRSGTAFSAGMFVPADAVKIKGEPRYYEVTADSGKRRRLGFCLTCGSPLFSKAEALPNGIAIAAASLDDPGQFHPSVSVYTSSAPGWAIFPEGVQNFRKMHG